MSNPVRIIPPLGAMGKDFDPGFHRGSIHEASMGRDSDYLLTHQPFQINHPRRSSGSADLFSFRSPFMVGPVLYDEY